MSGGNLPGITRSVEPKRHPPILGAGTETPAALRRAGLRAILPRIEISLMVSG